MYRCKECGFVFEEPYEYEETHGLDTPPYEKWSVCPRCKESGIEEIEEVECSRCGELIEKECARISDDLQYFCDICYEDLGYE
jgi:hypothetical protein